MAEKYEPSQLNGCNATVTVRREIVLIIDLLPPMKDVNEAQWTSEWLKNSSPGIETQIFNGIDGCWPSESELIECLSVVITGSTCSCVDDYPHTEPLFAFFKTVIQLEIPLLTICYSSQMLVRWLVGKENAIRLPEPHIGFIRIESLVDHDVDCRFPLFNDVLDGSLISLSAQSDGFILPDQLKTFSVQVGSTMQETRFVHRASATKWKDQAFQLLDLPVWGVQFHPNWPADGAETVFCILKSHNPNVMVERQGTFDEDGRSRVARKFLFTCRHHVLHRRAVYAEMSCLTNRAIPNYIAQKDESLE